MDIKTTTITVLDILSRLRKRFQPTDAEDSDGTEEPFRATLYSSKQLNDHGQSIAAAHRLRQNKVPDKLLERLDQNEQKLLEVRNKLVESIRSGKTIPPAAEWLLDNFYLIEEQVVLARKHLPKGYSEGLPGLASGLSAGMPRVYDIVLELIAHSDGRVDVQSLTGFVAAYQSVTLLTLGELWAIPIMLRLAVLENLRRVCSKIALDIIDYEMADYWAEKMIDTAKHDPGDLILTIADMVRSKPVLEGPFVSGLIRRLHGHGQALALPLNWMEDQLSVLDTNSNDLVSQEGQRQATDQVSVRNSIGTLRFLSTNDWAEFVETLSSVEQILRKDRTGIYPLMDFATRDRYRHAVEKIAKYSPLSETQIAEKILELTAPYPTTETRDSRAHVGYYIIGKGLADTQRVTKMRFTIRKKLVRAVSDHPVLLYLSSILLLTAFFTAGMLYWTFHNSPSGILLTILALALFVSGAMQLAVALVNWVATLTVKPGLLPRMDFSRGIPPECRSLIVVPTVLSSKAYIEELTEALEIRFLANREENLHYGLLTDFADAAAEHEPHDEELLAVVKNNIEILNKKYSAPKKDIFFLFHRPRTWNDKERRWMGYERKRGKLAALDALLCGATMHSEFSMICGEQDPLSRIKYVITLDSDTQLPREAAWKLIATMAHPLNHAVYDRKLRRVTEGYGILQPRIAPAISGNAASWYQRMQGNNAGIDPYTQVSSDVYQDVFGEGSFIGKGIYDIDIFRQATQDVFQENRILSHDLLEGCYARSGLLSDVLLYEENPAQYTTDVKRRHRWVRGDWQIGAWMMPWVTLANGSLTTNHLSLLSRWKIVDNLRRSLLPLSLLLLLLLGWTVLPYAWFWTFIVTLIITLPVLAGAGWQLVHKPQDLSVGTHLSEIGLLIRDIVLQFTFGVAVLPYETWKNVDAIIRANWRLIVSKRKLLEWTPSATLNRGASPHAAAAYIHLWQPPLLAIICGSVLAWIHPPAIPVAAPVLLLWLLAPEIVRRISLPEKEANPGLDAAQYSFLHKTARKTWAFFEQFVTEEDHWLPPDNFQEEPVPVIAHRTSPTNIGLSLLSSLTAFDFGYISGDSLIRRTRNTFRSMLQLEKYKGHFYNWYDTQTLLPLFPRYVSTVDSGNLIGHLLTLKQGLQTLPDQPVAGPNIFKGISTTLDIVRDYFKKSHKEAIAQITAAIAETTTSDSLTAIRNCLDLIIHLLIALPKQRNGQNKEGHMWLTLLLLQVQHIREDLLQVIPWLDLLPAPASFGDTSLLDKIPSLATIAPLAAMTLEIIRADETTTLTAFDKQWTSSVRSLFTVAAERAKEQILLLQQLSQQCEDLSTVEYDFLYDKSTSLLRIGYNVEEQRKDDSCYDLLASEARLGIFAGIAQGKLPQASWFALGRLLTNAGDPVLLSWSGSMFEYLMPQLVMPSYENTLLAQTSKGMVRRQIEYAAQQGTPWGISESAYNAIDTAFSYQYRAFGVPGLGLKRGLEDDLVIAPYASMLALMVAPEKACANLQLLAAKGFEGSFGFYEAIDYTINRLPRGKKHVVVRSFMAHHQGMGFLSLAYLLLNKPMQRRFNAELRFQATLLLLQERIPRTTLFYAHTAALMQKSAVTSATPERRIPTANTPIPEVQLLSNGRYQVMVTNSGSGYSRWRDMALTRWREDVTMDPYGIYCYIRNVQDGTFWSNTHQPVLADSDSYEAVFSQGHVEFRRTDQGLETKTEIVISPEDDVEMRRIRITNRTESTKVLEVTSYTEIVIASQASDETHPAFSNLFVQTEILREHKAILSTRRPRSQTETPLWMFHLMDVYGVAVEAVSYETDRMRFIGRGRSLANPASMHTDQLSNSQGAVLDPVFAIRYRFTVEPGQTALIDMAYGASETKEHCRALMHKYKDQHLKKRAFELSWTHSQVLLRQINANLADAQLYDQLAASVIFMNPALRGAPAMIHSNYRGQSGLWSHSVSGDLPIVLLRIDDPEQIGLVRQMIQAHAYWRLKGLAVDLVILNRDHGSYRQVFQEQVLGLISADPGNKVANSNPGNIFVRSADQLSPEDHILFESVAKVIIDGKGSLSEQVGRLSADKILPAVTEWQPLKGVATDFHSIDLPDDLLFYNGSGGFSSDGRTYQILTTQQNITPAPWVNVIANAYFGTVLSESGSAYTWAVNAHEYRLTPWSNDPVSDVGGEAFYIRDESSGDFWSPASFPAGGATPYITIHGAGYSIFEHSEIGVFTELCIFVDKELPQKFIVLKVKNNSGRERQLSATGFMEMILGDRRSKTSMHILPELGTTGDVLLFRNRFNTVFADQVSFFRVSGIVSSYTTDRMEFIGRNRSLQNPQALSRRKLSGKVAAGRDICAALQVKFDLQPGEEKEIIFQLGSCDNDTSVKALMQKRLDQDIAAAALLEVKEYWAGLLDAIQVKTPDPALDLLANGWLLYQTISSRLFARSGFYQSGGAFGFRDQLQDALALLHTAPGMAKEQLLLNASRQFALGDVLHWWHPPEGRGVRTRCSDDLLWLPFVLIQYLSVTGDSEILGEIVPFLEGRMLLPGEDSLYDLPRISDQEGNLYEHCVRSIKHSLLSLGEHGLPLMGSGDWNDGMDRVGHNGRGESVWLSFFLYRVLTGFREVATEQGDIAFALQCQEAATTLQTNIEKAAWDGDWYLRAWFDNGIPLGSHTSEECRIDALVQSWSVLSGAAGNERKQKAMASLDKYLIKRDTKLIALLEPAFDTSALDPGYIKGYVPGIRENGGQYSHAAIWALMAFVKLGEREKAYELFRLIQPVSHSADKTARDIYKVEPYVMAADVYANESHKGRGGWTWYTGAAGWMYQFITGSLLGLERRSDSLHINPCFPLSWPSVSIAYQYGRSTYNIVIYQLISTEPSHWTLDQEKGTGNLIKLTDDGKSHDMIIHCAVLPATTKV